MIPDGCELLLGLVFDAQFGPMLTVGMGGIFVEVLKDFRMLPLLPLPTTSAVIGDALASLRGAPLLHGVRGRPPADFDAIVDAALSLATLASDLGDCISEVDVNPLVALPDRAIVVDALVVPSSQGRE
jgi:acyl-CoA synthetase (NDP forming)